MLDEQYRSLFALIARNGAINGENALEVIQKEEAEVDEENIKSTERTIESFRKLEEKIISGNEPLTGLDYTYLWLGAVVSKEMIARNLERWAIVADEYDNNIIPALETVARMTDEEDRDAAIVKLIDKQAEEDVQEIKSVLEKENETEN